MANIEVLLPKMGESVAEATITNWLKNVGDSIESEESIVEIATDKVDSEVPSPADGVITEVRFQEGDVAQVGDVIAVISAEGEVNQAPTQPDPQATEAKPSSTSVIEAQPSKPEGISITPLGLSIAQKEGLSVNEMDKITGTGHGGKVTKSDVLNYLDPSQAATAPAKPVPVKKPDTPVVQASSDTAKEAGNPYAGQIYSGDHEVIEMDRMRKLIANHMVSSKKTSPHVTSFVEADVTNLVNWRNNVKNEFLKKTGEKLTFTPLFVEATVRAIQDFPMVNVAVSGTSIIKRKAINIGMATALPTGNLIVPVLHHADEKNLTGLAASVNDLANRARQNKLKPDEVQGGTFTITNVGTFGNVMGMPIINQPQVAILAVGAIRKKPAIAETEFGDSLVIRHKMFLSMSYDHRVVDGALGGSLLRRVADYLEQFDVNREI